MQFTFFWLEFIESTIFFLIILLKNKVSRYGFNFMLQISTWLLKNIFKTSWLELFNMKTPAWHKFVLIHVVDKRLDLNNMIKLPPFNFFGNVYIIWYFLWTPFLLLVVESPKKQLNANYSLEKHLTFKIFKH